MCLQIFEMFQTLFLHSLLPIQMLQMEDFLGGVSIIPLRRSQPARAAPRSDGLLSALSSYLMTPYSSSSETLVPEATDSDVEHTLSTIDCINSCRLDGLYSQIMYVIMDGPVNIIDLGSRQLDSDALVAAVRALEALAHERTVARLTQEADEMPQGDAVAQDGPYALPYDPASVFLLETMVSIASQTPQYIEEVWCVNSLSSSACQDMTQALKACHLRAPFGASVNSNAVQYTLDRESSGRSSSALLYTCTEGERANLIP